MDSASLFAGSTISYYRIVSKIGAGRMGEVYLPEDVSLARVLTPATSAFAAIVAGELN